MPKSKEVDAWFSRYENPMKDVVLAIREVILAADPRIEECIKWQAPTFSYRGNLASFFPKSKQHASLMFHQGAKIPGAHPRLEGDGDTSRVLKLGSLAEVKAARADLVKIVKAWCAYRDSEGGGARKPTAKKAAATPAKKAAATPAKKAAATPAKKKAAATPAKKKATATTAKKKAAATPAKKKVSAARKPRRARG